MCKWLQKDMVDALRQCNQEVPAKLKSLAEDSWKMGESKLIGAEVCRGEIIKQTKNFGFWCCKCSHRMSHMLFKVLSMCSLLCPFKVLQRRSTRLLWTQVKSWTKLPAFFKVKSRSKIRVEKWLKYVEMYFGFSHCEFLETQVTRKDPWDIFLQLVTLLNRIPLAFCSSRRGHAGPDILKHLSGDRS